MTSRPPTRGTGVVVEASGLPSARLGEVNSSAPSLHVRGEAKGSVLPQTRWLRRGSAGARRWSPSASRAFRARFRPATRRAAPRRRSAAARPSRRRNPTPAPRATAAASATATPSPSRPSSRVPPASAFGRRRRRQRGRAGPAARVARAQRLRPPDLGPRARVRETAAEVLPRNRRRVRDTTAGAQADCCDVFHADGRVCRPDYGDDCSAARRAPPAPPRRAPRARRRAARRVSRVHLGLRHVRHVLLAPRRRVTRARL